MCKLFYFEIMESRNLSSSCFSFIHNYSLNTYHVAGTAVDTLEESWSPFQRKDKEQKCMLLRDAKC